MADGTRAGLCSWVEPGPFLPGCQTDTLRIPEEPRQNQYSKGQRCFNQRRARPLHFLSCPVLSHPRSVLWRWTTSPGLGGGRGRGCHVYQLFWVKRAERDFFSRLLDSEELWLVSVSRPHRPAAGAGGLHSRVHPTVTEEVGTSARLICEARLFLLLLLFLSPVVAGMSGPGTKSRTPRRASARPWVSTICVRGRPIAVSSPSSSSSVRAAKLSQCEVGECLRADNGGAFPSILPLFY